MLMIGESQPVLRYLGKEKTKYVLAIFSPTVKWSDPNLIAGGAIKSSKPIAWSSPFGFVGTNFFKKEGNFIIELHKYDLYKRFNFKVLRAKRAGSYVYYLLNQLWWHFWVITNASFFGMG